MDNGGRIRVNRKVQIVWIVALAAAIIIVFGGLLFPMLKEIILNPPSVGHEHIHNEGGGEQGGGEPSGAPAGTGAGAMKAPPGGPGVPPMKGPGGPMKGPSGAAAPAEGGGH